MAKIYIEVHKNIQIEWGTLPYRMNILNVGVVKKYFLEKVNSELGSKEQKMIRSHAFLYFQQLRGKKILRVQEREHSS